MRAQHGERATDARQLDNVEAGEGSLVVAEEQTQGEVVSAQQREERRLAQTLVELRLQALVRQALRQGQQRSWSPTVMRWALLSIE